MAKNSILSFGLVSIEVKIDNAVKSAAKDVSFDSASPEGNPVEQIYRDKETGEIVGGRTDLIKGKFVGDEFREIPQDKQDEIKEITKLDNVDLHFASAKNIDLTTVKGKHYVTAKTGYENKLRLLIEAMKKSKKVFVAKWMPVSRQALMVGVVEDNRLVMLEVPYAAQRKPQPEVQGEKPTAKALTMATKLIESATDEGYIDEAIDEQVELKREAIQAVVDGKPVKKRKAKKATPADQSLEELLEASLA